MTIIIIKSSTVKNSLVQTKKCCKNSAIKSSRKKNLRHTIKCTCYKNFATKLQYKNVNIWQEPLSHTGCAQKDSSDVWLLCGSNYKSITMQNPWIKVLVKMGSTPPPHFLFSSAFNEEFTKILSMPSTVNDSNTYYVTHRIYNTKSIISQLLASNKVWPKKP